MRISVITLISLFLVGCSLAGGVVDLRKELTSTFEIDKKEVSISYHRFSAGKAHSGDVAIMYLTQELSKLGDSARVDIAFKSADIAVSSLGLTNNSRIVVVFVDAEKAKEIIPTGMDVVSEHKFKVSDSELIEYSPNESYQSTDG